MRRRRVGFYQPHFSSFLNPPLIGIHFMSMFFAAVAMVRYTSRKEDACTRLANDASSVETFSLTDIEPAGA
jgi:hypothetical protein